MCCWRWVPQLRRRVPRCVSPSAGRRRVQTSLTCSTLSSRWSPDPGARQPGGRGCCEGPGSDERRGGLFGGSRPRGGRRARGRRGSPGAVGATRHVAHRRPRVLHERGCRRCSAGRRHHRRPVLRVGLRGAVQRRRGGRLRRGVRRRADPQSVPAVQREDQVYRAAGSGLRAGLRRGLHRSLRTPGRRRATPSRGRGQGPVLRARQPHRRPAGPCPVPGGRHAQGWHPG